MLYAIYAYDQMHGGLNGMYLRDLIEDDSMEEAEQYAKECSLEVIESYGCIFEALYDEAAERVDEDDVHKFYEVLEQLCKEDVAYEVYELRDGIEVSFDELREEYFHTPDEFLAEYKKK